MQVPEELLQGLKPLLEKKETRDWMSFLTVKHVYAWLFGDPKVTSIDMSGTPAAYKLDLNEPLYLTPDEAITCDSPRHQFTTVINHGTAEHIFNVSQVFRTMHDHCAVGGLMIHEAPLTGWFDHGFYNIQPTAFYDLCAANGYKLVYMAVTHIEQNVAVPIESREQLLQMAKNGGVPWNSMLWVAMRKEVEGEFKIPMQGYYANTISDEAKAAWSALR